MQKAELPIGKSYWPRVPALQGAPKKVYCVVIASEDGPCVRSSFKTYIESNLESNYHTVFSILAQDYCAFFTQVSCNGYTLLNND